MNLKQAIEWYEEGERDQDFLVHLAGLAIPHIAELEAEVARLTERCQTWHAEANTQRVNSEQAEAKVEHLHGVLEQNAAELAALLKIMREGGCRDCDDLTAELAALKATNEQLIGAASDYEKLDVQTEDYAMRWQNCVADNNILSTELAALEARDSALATTTDPGAPSPGRCSECGVMEDFGALKAERDALRFVLEKSSDGSEMWKRIASLTAAENRKNQLLLNAQAELAALKSENERLDTFCREFIWGEDNPHEYKMLFECAEQAEAKVEHLYEVLEQNAAEMVALKTRWQRLREWAVEGELWVVTDAMDAAEGREA